MKALYSLMLKGTLAAAVATFAVAGCSDNGDNDEPGGEAGDGSGGSTAGTKTTGGSKSEAGETSGGTTPGGAQSAGGGGAGPDAGGDGGVGGGEGGAGGVIPDPGPDPFAAGGAGLGGAPYAGPAIAKFCNSLTFGTEEEPMATTFRLEVGEGIDMVSFTATTGACAPPDGQECKAIPTGADVLIQLFDVDGEEPLDTSGATIAADSQYVFFTDLSDDAEPFPIWNGLPVNSRFACEDVTYDDVP